MKKRILIIGPLLVIFSMVFLLASCGGDSDNSIYVYHFSPIARRLEAEARPMPSGYDLVETVIGFMHAEPLSGTLVTTWPYQLAPTMEDLVQAVILEDTMLLVFLKPIFHEMQSLEQTLFKAAFIYTMESLIERALTSVTEIKILVTEDYLYAFDTLMVALSAEEDEEAPDVPWLIYDGGFGLYNDPFVSRALLAPLTFSHLFFVDETGTGLFIESYTTDEADHQLEERFRQALSLLINDFRPEGALFPIPQETIIRNMWLDGDTVFLDLSSDFVTRFDGDARLAELMIFSIVNTLTRFPPNRVIFLIDDEPLEVFHGVQDFHLPFVQDDSFLLEYILEREADERDAREQEEQLGQHQ